MHYPLSEIISEGGTNGGMLHFQSVSCHWRQLTNLASSMSRIMSKGLPFLYYEVYLKGQYQEGYIAYRNVSKND